MLVEPLELPITWLIICKAVTKSSCPCSDVWTEARGGVGGQDGVVLFPRTIINRTEVRSQMVAAPAGFWMRCYGEGHRIAQGIGWQVQEK